MKNLALVFLTILSLNALANKVIEELEVNFFTLAANEKELDGEKIGIKGWIKFLDYKDKKSIRLFQSKSSLNEFRVEESILVVIPIDAYSESKEYLDLKLVTVYGQYISSKKMGIYGELTQIRDIDISPYSSGI